MLIVLLRHAVAGQRRGWSADDRLRPLTAVGRCQAAALVVPLAGAGPSRLLTSAYLRCQQTLEPLAAKTGLAVEPVEWLGADVSDRADAADVVSTALRKLVAGGDGPVVLCTHGEVIAVALATVVPAGVLARASASGAPEPPGDKGGWWSLSWDGAVVVATGYHPPPS